MKTPQDILHEMIDEMDEYKKESGINQWGDCADSFTIDEVKDKLKEALSRMERECGWRKIDEEKPPSDTIVYCYSENNGCFPGYWIYGDKFIGQYQGLEMTATHWIPLPQPHNK